MRSSFAWLLVGLVACTNVNTAQDSGTPPPAPAPTVTATPPITPTPPTEPTPPTSGNVTVQMTAATLADDCGGPPAPAKVSAGVKSKEMAAGATRGARARRACEQSSMQLSVVAPAGAAASQLAVKQVELFDDKGAKIGDLTARTSSVWDADGTYHAWDQNVAPGQELSVSYALSEPPWSRVPDRRSRSYVLKAVITVGGADQSVQRDVTVDAPTILPPNVRT